MSMFLFFFFQQLWAKESLTWIISNRGLPRNLEFYSNASFTGKPQLLLSPDGVFYLDKKLCSWKDGKLNSARDAKSLLQNCPPDLPFKTVSTNEFQEDLIVVVSERKIDAIPIYFRGKTLYLKVGKWRNDFYCTTDRNNKRDLSQDMAFQALKTEINNCLKANNSDCFVDQFQSSANFREFALLGKEADDEFECSPDTQKDDFSREQTAACLVSEKGKQLRKELEVTFNKNGSNATVDYGYSLDSPEHLIISSERMGIRLQKIDDKYKIVRITR